MGLPYCPGNPNNECTDWKSYWFWYITGSIICLTSCAILGLLCRCCLRRVSMKRVINNEFVIQYTGINDSQKRKKGASSQNRKKISPKKTAGGYTINNAVLYGNGVYLLLTYLFDILDWQWNAYSLSISLSICGCLGVCFCYSNWKSYYRVTGEFLDRLTGMNHPIISQTSINTKKQKPQPNVVLKPKESRLAKIVYKWEKVSAIGGSILKAIASSASWFTFIEEFFGLWPALGTTLFFLPACGLSQIAFLNIASESPKESTDEINPNNENEYFGGSEHDAERGGNIDSNDNNNLTDEQEEHKPIVIISPPTPITPFASQNNIGVDPRSSQRFNSQNFSSRHFTSQRFQKKKDKSFLSSLWCFHP